MATNDNGTLAPKQTPVRDLPPGSDQPATGKDLSFSHKHGTLTPKEKRSNADNGRSLPIKRLKTARQATPLDKVRNSALDD